MNKHIGLLVVAASLAGSLGCEPEIKLVVVEPKNMSFTKPDKVRQLEASAQEIDSTPVKGVQFEFRSKDTSVATVSAGGEVQPVGDGSTTVEVIARGTSVSDVAFVKVCLPKEIVCDPPDELKLKVGLAAPIKCHVIDCNDAKIAAGVELEPAEADPKMLLKEGGNVFIGLAVGDTTVKVTALGLEKTVAVHVDEQEFLPGMGPGSGKRRGGGGQQDDGDPYGNQGRFNHIIDNMKFD